MSSVPKKAPAKGPKTPGQVLPEQKLRDAILKWRSYEDWLDSELSEYCKIADELKRDRLMEPGDPFHVWLKRRPQWKGPRE
jgi:hypothetical protein